MTYRATPEDYRAIFEDDRRGAAIFEQLYRLFGTAVYVPGGQDGDRETCYRAGRRDVIEFITRQINRANGVEEVGDHTVQNEEPN